ncbi:L-lactate dehydrogenase, partial [bacterium]|nr:L-lactate dehydrogenase [bacterium]
SWARRCVKEKNHPVPLTHPPRIWAGHYEDTAGAAITVVTAGTAQKPGETRLDLVQRNASILKSIIPEVVHYNPDGLILIAANPVDILTYSAWKLSGLPSNRVIGSGTILDTARFRYLLSQYARVDARSVHAYIIGEHGDSEVPVWSLANIAGMNLEDYFAMNCRDCEKDVFDRIFEATRDAAYQIIQRKGSTYYAIGSGLQRIVEAILRDQDTVLSISTLIEDFHGVNDVYLSLPCILGRNGVKQVLKIPLNQKEEEGFIHSANVMQENIRSIGL